MWRYTIPLAMFAVIAVFFFRGLSLNPSYVPSPLVGKTMPEFALPSLKNPEVMLGSENLKGQVALFNVWGTWCVECRHEHGFLVELARAGVPIYGLNLKDERDSALRWLATLGDPYVGSAFDVDGVVAVDWGVTAAPETFLIGRDGTVLHKHISPLTPQIWRRDFEPLLEKECGTSGCPFLAAAGGR
jgi:cytochrome c biogenesis protein CcmG/thiol:disulfide interchange protein DsbE